MARAPHLYLKEAKQAAQSALNMLEDLEKELTVAGCNAVAIQGQQVAAAMYKLAGGMDVRQTAVDEALERAHIRKDLGERFARELTK